MTATEAAAMAIRAETDPEIGHLMPKVYDLIRHVAARGGREIAYPWSWIEKSVGLVTRYQMRAIREKLASDGYLVGEDTDGIECLSW